jgi:hypothetical protein
MFKYCELPVYFLSKKSVEVGFFLHSTHRNVFTNSIIAVCTQIYTYLLYILSTHIFRIFNLLGVCFLQYPHSLLKQLHIKNI